MHSYAVLRSWIQRKDLRREKNRAAKRYMVKQLVISFISPQFGYIALDPFTNPLFKSNLTYKH